MLGEFEATDEDIIVSLADDIVAEKEAAGQQLNWPAGMDVDSAEEEADYLPDIWQEAEQKWNEMSEVEKEQSRTEFRDRMEEFAEIFKKEFRAQAFKASFSGWDILWFLLACGTAFRIAMDDEV